MCIHSIFVGPSIYMTYTYVQTIFIWLRSVTRHLYQIITKLSNNLNTHWHNIYCNLLLRRFIGGSWGGGGGKRFCEVCTCHHSIIILYCYLFFMKRITIILMYMLFKVPNIKYLSHPKLQLNFEYFVS